MGQSQAKDAPGGDHDLGEKHRPVAGGDPGLTYEALTGCPPEAGRMYALSCRKGCRLYPVASAVSATVQHCYIRSAESREDIVLMGSVALCCPNTTLQVLSMINTLFSSCHFVLRIGK